MLYASADALLYASADAFLKDPHKVLTLVGMSNVGKTRLASRMPRNKWFHYSVDYRLATAYLREEIVDDLKREMISRPRLARHLREDSLRIDLNVEFTNLFVVSDYLGMLGNPLNGGLPEREFRRRQEQHRMAEMSAAMDLPAFIAKARTIYGYPHLINDASGSLCELIDPDDPGDPVLQRITEHSLIVYIEPDRGHETKLITAALDHPKPLYYRPAFLDDALAALRAEGLVIDETDPRDLVRRLFPRLLAARRPRYEHIARRGCRIGAEAAARVHDEDAFLELVAEALDTTLRTTPVKGVAESATPRQSIEGSIARVL